MRAFGNAALEVAREFQHRILQQKLAHVASKENTNRLHARTVLQNLCARISLEFLGRLLSSTVGTDDHKIFPATFSGRSGEHGVNDELLPVLRERWKVFRDGNGSECHQRSQGDFAACKYSIVVKLKQTRDWDCVEQTIVSSNFSATSSRDKESM